MTALKDIIKRLDNNIAYAKEELDKHVDAMAAEVDTYASDGLTYGDLVTIRKLLLEDGEL